MSPEQIMDQPHHGNAGHDGANMNNKTAAGDKKNEEKQTAPNQGQHQGQKTRPMVRRRRFIKGHWSFLQGSFYGIMSSTPKYPDKLSVGFRSDYGIPQSRRGPAKAGGTF